MTDTTYADILRSLAAQLERVAAMEPATAVRALGPLSARNTGSGVESMLTKARRAAAQVVVEQMGGQRAAAPALGMAQPNLSRLLADKGSPQTWGKLANPARKRGQRAAVDSSKLIG